MSLIFSEIIIHDQGTEQLSFYESGHPDQADILELLGYNQSFGEAWQASGQDAWISVQHYCFLAGGEREQLGESEHFALIYAYDEAAGPEYGRFIDRDDVAHLEYFTMKKDNSEVEVPHEFTR